MDKSHHSKRQLYQRHVPAPLSILDLDVNNSQQLNSTSRSTKHILQKRVSLGSCNSLASQNTSKGAMRSSKVASNQDSLVKRIQGKIMGEQREDKKSNERDGGEFNGISNDPTCSQSLKTAITTTQMTSPLKQPLLKAFQWQNNLTSSSTAPFSNTSSHHLVSKQGKRKNSLQILFVKGEEGSHEGGKNGPIKNCGGTQNIEMIRKKASHKRLATVSSQSKSSTGNNNPPFSKNLILSQLAHNGNYQTATKQPNCSRNLETLLSSGSTANRNNCIFSTSNKFIFRTSNDMSTQKNQELIVQSSPIQMAPHFFGRQSNSSSAKERVLRHNDYKIQEVNYQCETGASQDHKISPLLSQNSMIQSSYINCSQGAIVQPSVTNRPQSNLAATHGNIGIGTNILNFTRPSYDNAALQTLNRSDRLDQPLITRYEQHFEDISSSSDDEGKISYQSNSSQENDMSIDERGFSTSQCDMIQSTGCSILEGPTGIKLPISQIKTCGHQVVMQPRKLLKQNSRVDINCPSQQTTERNNKPFDRPQILNSPQPGLVVQNILAQSRSPKRGHTRQKTKLQLQKHTKSTILDRTIQEISGAGMNINKSRSSSPASDVDAEYFQSGMQNTSGTLRRKNQSFELINGHSSQNLWTLLETYCKKGDLVRLSSLFAQPSLYHKLYEHKRNLLYKCLDYNQPGLLKYLLQNLKPPLQQHHVPETFNLLHIALKPRLHNPDTSSSKNEINLFKTILAHDLTADVNALDTYGNTPLHLAVQQQRTEIVRLFLKGTTGKVHISIKNSEGKSAMEYAREQSTIKYFLDYISRLKSVNNYEAKLELSKIETQILPLPQIQKLINSYRKEFKENQTKNIDKPTITAKSKASGKVINFGTKKYSTQSMQCETEPRSKKRSQLEIIDQVKMQQMDYYLPCKTELNCHGSSEDDQEQTIQFCEQIEEVSEESLQNSIIGKKVGPNLFEPLSLIGKGSFGEVYLVRKRDGKKEKQLYAMKVLQKEKILGQNLVKYAITERNVLSITKHPFIVGLNYAFQTREKLFLILDYCPGGDLGKMLVEEKRFDESRAKIYLAEILLALEDLHKRDIIFRDLKPDNVVLDSEGHALLTDFGLSKEGVLDNQAAKSFCGSVAYLAPEMLKRCGHGKSVDWYLLGVLLYEMLVGIPPYFNRNREKLMSNIQRGTLLIPSQLSQEAKDLIISLLSKNPLRRLGAGIRDAEEIKEHPFFKDIEWVKVYNRQLKPPKPKMRQNIQLESSQMISYAQILAKEEKGKMDNVLPGWSFASPSNF